MNAFIFLFPHFTAAAALSFCARFHFNIYWQAAARLSIHPNGPFIRHIYLLHSYLHEINLTFACVCVCVCSICLFWLACVLETL